ncbi:hypothetical protein C8R43DRAFT_1170349 [Mycena crocata]|nr:hypothetical protein C8R43DRAFT_1170349 [Mycena crocata]
MATIDLPNELWFELFQFLPLNALAKVHAVSSRFHDISHSLFFRDFRLDPDQHKPSTGTFRRRLALYSSAPIAQHVRKLVVSFQFGRWLRMNNEPLLTSLNSSNPLVVPLLESLPNFSNLRILEIYFRLESEVHFANLGLQGLPNLQELHVHGGALYSPPTALAAKISVSHFSFSAIPGFHFERSGLGHVLGLRRSFLSMLDPETLCSLTLSPSYDCSPAAWLSADRTIFRSFRKLSSITIGCDGPFIGPVHEFLAELPGLRDLTLRGDYRAYNRFSPGAVSLTRELQSYTGPFEYIPIFLPRTACTRLSIDQYCAPDELYNALEKTECTSSVTDLSLVIHIAELAEWAALAHTLFTLFAHLERLRIRISDVPRDEDWDMLDRSVDADMFDVGALSDLPTILATLLSAPAALSHAVVEWDLCCCTMCLLPSLEDWEEEILVAREVSGVRSPASNIRESAPVYAAPEKE